MRTKDITISNRGGILNIFHRVSHVPYTVPSDAIQLQIQDRNHQKKTLISGPTRIFLIRCPLPETSDRRPTLFRLLNVRLRRLPPALLLPALLPLSNEPRDECGFPSSSEQNLSAPPSMRASRPTSRSLRPTMKSSLPGTSGSSEYLMLDSRVPMYVRNVYVCWMSPFSSETTILMKGSCEASFLRRCASRRAFGRDVCANGLSSTNSPSGEDGGVQPFCGAQSF